ncbi:MAG: hypothetical protein HC841_00335 [Verrucomicrobiae bacterium]|nr:hypothetical protein [Verrucomicrobiae bacterium]
MTEIPHWQERVTPYNPGGAEQGNGIPFDGSGSMPIFWPCNPMPWQNVSYRQSTQPRFIEFEAALPPYFSLTTQLAPGISPDDPDIVGHDGENWVGDILLKKAPLDVQYGPIFNFPIDPFGAGAHFWISENDEFMLTYDVIPGNAGLQVWTLVARLPNFAIADTTWFPEGAVVRSYLTGKGDREQPYLRAGNPSDYRGHPNTREPMNFYLAAALFQGGGSNLLHRLDQRLPFTYEGVLSTHLRTPITVSPFWP